MRRIERPLDHDAVQSADEQIYDAHQDDPRPNALFDADGNQKQLSSTDPSQEALRQEWRADYFAALDAKKGATADDEVDNSQAPQSDNPESPTSSSNETNNDPGNPVASCPDTHWITIQLQPKKRAQIGPTFWPAPPPETAFYCEFYKAEITDGHKEDYLNESGAASYTGIPAGDCSIEFPIVFNDLRDYFDAVVRRGEKR
jgi:hypothetical protein